MVVVLVVEMTVSAVPINYQTIDLWKPSVAGSNDKRESDDERSSPA
jgi:hypothetical protein